MIRVKKQINIIGSIVAMLVISISGLGTYAFKGVMADLKASVLKAKDEIFKELEDYYNAKIKTEFEEMKNSIKEELKRTTEFINAVNKENLVLEVKNIFSKERIKTQELIKEEIEKNFRKIGESK
ncbi:hypothetical protein QIA17_05360 (plasmid) [Borreliella californiensis]|uniref:Uncharacterized protein n=1 Tax=Borreliella californiensis TaxID=373543 RepID=A0A7X0DPY0_9SPIR|nr:hypothetical protein [Borreliella californiensis]MBB6213616.1 hypothetical protein [Borreliella californiensis]MBB6213631.1 hypothetical protein [Borreliella californiensis]